MVNPMSTEMCASRLLASLLYGVQPKKAHGRLKPGNCKGKVHQRATLGIGGRRILISRDWSGKTLAEIGKRLFRWLDGTDRPGLAQLGDVAAEAGGGQPVGHDADPS